MNFKIGDKVRIVNLNLVPGDDGIRIITTISSRLPIINLKFENGIPSYPQLIQNLILLDDPSEIFKEILKNG